MKILILILLTISTIFATEIFTQKYVGAIKTPWGLVDKKIYETCINGFSFYIVEAGYQSGLAPVSEEIVHPILGKIIQHKKCRN